MCLCAHAHTCMCLCVHTHTCILTPHCRLDQANRRKAAAAAPPSAPHSTRGLSAPSPAQIFSAVRGKDWQVTQTLYSRPQTPPPPANSPHRPWRRRRKKRGKMSRGPSSRGSASLQLQLRSREGLRVILTRCLGRTVGGWQQQHRGCKTGRLRPLPPKKKQTQSWYSARSLRTSSSSSSSSSRARQRDLSVPSALKISSSSSSSIVPPQPNPPPPPAVAAHPLHPRPHALHPLLLLLLLLQTSLVSMRHPPPPGPIPQSAPHR